MKTLSAFLLVIILLPLRTLAQNNHVPDSVIHLFHQEKLPLCIGYSHDEQVFFGAVFHTDSVVIQDADTSYVELQDVYEENTYQKDAGSLLNTTFVKHSLLPSAGFIYDTNDKGDTLHKESLSDYLTSDFYAVSLVASTTKYYAVIYERVFNTSDVSSSEKFLCTFTNRGRFISRIMIASFVYSGTGFSDSGARFPWFPEETGCIDSQLSVLFKSYEGDKTYYQIQKDGMITKDNSRQNFPYNIQN